MEKGTTEWGEVVHGRSLTSTGDSNRMCKVWNDVTEGVELYERQEWRRINLGWIGCFRSRSGRERERGRLILLVRDRYVNLIDLNELDEVSCQKEKIYKWLVDGTRSGRQSLIFIVGFMNDTGVPRIQPVLGYSTPCVECFFRCLQIFTIERISPSVSINCPIGLKFTERKRFVLRWKGIGFKSWKGADGKSSYPEYPRTETKSEITSKYKVIC